MKKTLMSMKGVEERWQQKMMGKKKKKKTTRKEVKRAYLRIKGSELVFREMQEMNARTAAGSRVVSACSMRPAPRHVRGSMA